MAREKFGRDVHVWTSTFVVQRDSQKEAEDYLHYYAVEDQDRDCGIDGVLLTWVDYVAGMNNFNVSVLPQLEQAGLRE